MLREASENFIKMRGKFSPSRAVQPPDRVPWRFSTPENRMRLREGMFMHALHNPLKRIGWNTLFIALTCAAVLCPALAADGAGQSAVPDFAPSSDTAWIQ